MTNNGKALREAGYEVVLRPREPDGMDHVLVSCRSGDLVVRPIPPPEPTVAEARKSLVAAIELFGEWCCAEGPSVSGIPRWDPLVDKAIDALIAAVERRAREGSP